MVKEPTFGHGHSPESGSILDKHEEVSKLVASNSYC